LKKQRRARGEGKSGSLGQPKERTRMGRVREAKTNVLGSDLETLGRRRKMKKERVTKR